MDNRLIYWLREQRIFTQECVSSIYYPIWQEDGQSARSWTDYSIKDWSQYRRIILECQNNGYPVEILMQTLNRIPDNVFFKYLELGVRKFTITQDFNAYRLKELAPDVFISASITKALSPEEIANNDLSMYDEVCLWFFFNFNFEAIKALPKNIEYSICGNTGCMPFCRHCLNHWFSDEMYDCRYSGDRDKMGVWQPGFTYEEYKKWLKDDISRIKILDRLSSFDQQVSSIEEFFRTDLPMHDYAYFNKQKVFPTIINKEHIFYGKK